MGETMAGEPDELLQRLRQVASQFSDRRALFGQDSKHHVTFGELIEAAERVGQLIDSQISARRVLLPGTTKPSSILAFLAVWLSGRSTVFVNERISDSEREVIRAETGAAVVLADQLVTDAVGRMRARGSDDSAATAAAFHYGREEVPQSDQGSDELLVICTSGTSGRPKILSHSVGSRMAFVQGIVDVFGITPQDRYLSLIPTAHSSGLAFSLAHLCVGAEVHSISARDGESVLRAVIEGDISTLLVVPTLLERIAAVPNAREGLRNVRLIVCMGAPLRPRRQAELVAELDCPIYQYYGASECSFLAVLGPDEARSAQDAVCGRPTPGTLVRLSTPDGDGNRILEVRTPRAATARISAEGEAPLGEWIRTGDVAHLDEQGFIHLLGRSDGTIISGGLNVDPKEVEAILLAHRSIVEAAVFGRDSSVWGQEVVALCVTQSGAAVTEEELKEFCRGSIASFKVPKKVRIVEELPVSHLGKLDKQRALSQIGSGE